jgi:hypothetical protein
MEEDLAGVGWKKKIKKFPIFIPPPPKKKRGESYKMKDFLIFNFGICAKLHTKDKKN